MICSKRDFELELIQRIRSNQATLIDFRNYIFSRKARLLTHLNRSDDLAKSALDYVKIGFTEMKNHININENGLRLWALLASMEANNVLECMKENTDSARQSLLLQNSALLLDMARQHLSGKRYIYIGYQFVLINHYVTHNVTHYVTHCVTYYVTCYVT